MVLLWILASTFLVSLISLIGVFTLSLKGKTQERFLFTLIGFSAGALIAGAFLDILPEVLEKLNSTDVFYGVLAGIVFFFSLEKYFYWRHCHDDNCHVHAFTYLNLIGESFHNFVDGMAIAVSFTVSIKLGLVTTLAIVLHEIPKELGNFGVLIYGGFSIKKAILYNLLSSLTAIAGAIIAYFLTGIIGNFSNLILPVTAGGFIYIASSDLIPEIHRQKDRKRSSLAFMAFLLGIAFMAITSRLLAH